MRPLLTLAAALLAGPALAQPAPVDPAADGAALSAVPADKVDQRARLMTMDTDHDGRWSKAEWLAGGRKARGFAMMDSDSDGYLTPVELEAGVAKLRAMHAARAR